MHRKRSSTARQVTPRWLVSAAALFAAGFLAVEGADNSAKPTAAAKSQAVAGLAEVVPFIAAGSHDKDLRELPYAPPTHESEPVRRMRHRLAQTPSTVKSDPPMAVKQSAQTAAMPSPITSFDGISSSQSGCACLPPDTHGDVGP